MTVVSLNTHRREKIGGSEAASACDSPCILFEGKLKDGYARVRIGGRHVRLHRHVYAECFGPIPTGYVVHHVCGVKHCLNPAHLQAITQREHVRGHDFMAARRALTHCKRGHARTPENLYITPDGWRGCKTCKLQLQRERRARAHHRED